MDKKKKVILIIAITLIILIITSVAIYLYNVNTKQKGTKDNIITNDSENFKQIKEYQNLSLSNIEFKYKENESIITGTLTNKSSEEIEETMLEIVLLDEQKNEKGTIYIYIDSIEGNSSKNVRGSIDQDYIEAYDCYIHY